MLNKKKVDSIESKKLFDEMIDDYLEKAKSHNLQPKPYQSHELEVSFGNRKPITRTDYENVISQLIRNGWASHNIQGDEMLRINSEIMDGNRNFGKPNDEEKKEDGDDKEDGNREDVVKETNEPITGGGNDCVRVRMSTTFRLEIVGSELIQQYCRSDSVDAIKKISIDGRSVKFTDKLRVKKPDNTFYDNASFPDHNFRVAYKFEWDQKIDGMNERVRSTLRNWSSSRKTYRCMNRVRFYHPDIPVYVDVSVIKTNRKCTPTTGKDKRPIIMPSYTLKSAGVFDNEPHYEVELEMNNRAIENNAKFVGMSKEQLMGHIRKGIRMVLSGLQETPYPISYPEQEDIYKEYMDLLHGEDNEQAPHRKRRTQNPITADFVGPQSVTLQKTHILKETENNILTNYMVTEKADGQRALLYISKTGKIYMIKGNMKIVFTGSKTTEQKCFNSLLDGEFILSGKHNKMLFLYAAFDIYYIGSRKDPHVRPMPFYPVNDILEEQQMSDTTGEDDERLEIQYRLSLLRTFVSMLNVQSVTENSDSSCLFRVQVKQFIAEPNIFDACKKLLDQKHSYEYETDGLIFTPMLTGVGSNKSGIASSPVKLTWQLSYKWKPPEFNTIDFYVVTEKNENKDTVKHVIHDSSNMMSSAVAYKIVHLHVTGKSNIDSLDGNIFGQVLEDKIDTVPPSNQHDSSSTSVPRLFKPNRPYDPTAYLCYIPLDKDMQMRTVPVEPDATPEVFDDLTIVEFRYAKDDDTKEGPWKWIPIRVRHDKTEILRSPTSGRKDYGNFYTVANSNWLSIHEPVTEDIISGTDILNEAVVEDSEYYDVNEKSSKHTEAMRNFHNMYIKNKIISSTAKFLQDSANIEEVHLIDYSVGTGGDLLKWKYSDIRFVLGIDLSPDNVITGKDNASLRYIEQRKKHKRMKLRALFLPGNSSLNIRTKAAAFQDTLHKQLVRSIFGEGNPLPAQSTYVFRHGIAREGFHISSCQFALHYFFESNRTLHSFLRNLSECTRLNGYFIGTCYDGQKVFDVLQNESGTFHIEKGGRILCDIKKKYSRTIQSFPNDETSVGMRVDVHQESIGHTFPEYLVSFEYFTRMLENYGFAPLSQPELEAMGLKSSTGSFKDMFATMKSELEEIETQNRLKKNEYGKAPKMTPEEMQISFLNRYFVFKKVRDIPQATLKNMNENDETPEPEQLYPQQIENKEMTQLEKDKIRWKEIKKIRKYQKQMKPVCRKISNTKIALEEDTDVVDSFEE